jgi:hypothetical protein
MTPGSKQGGVKGFGDDSDKVIKKVLKRVWRRGFKNLLKFGDVIYGTPQNAVIFSSHKNGIQVFFLLNPFCDLSQLKRKSTKSDQIS